MCFFTCKTNISSSAVSFLSCSEFQVKALPHGKLSRGYHSNGCPDKHSPDSACSVDYSSSRLSSPDHPNEGKMQRHYECIYMWCGILQKLAGVVLCHVYHLLSWSLILEPLHEPNWSHTPISLASIAVKIQMHCNRHFSKATEAGVG